MEEQGVRRRVITLHSQQTGKADEEEKPSPDKIEKCTLKEPSNVGHIREVAQGMFVSMCRGDEQEVITEEEVEGAIQRLSEASISPTKSLARAQDYAALSEGIKGTIRKLLKDCFHSSHTKEVTLEQFCEAAVQHCEGNISLLDMLDDKITVQVHVDEDEKPAPQDKVTHANLESLFHHPVQTVKLVKQGILTSVEKRGVRWMWSHFSTKHFYWFLVVYFLPMMTLQVIVSSVSTALFNGAILCMILITIQIAISAERFHSSQEYLSLFQYFNSSDSPIKIPLPRLDVVHYLTFTVALLVAVMSLGFSNHSFVYSELLVIVSLVLSVTVLLQFDLLDCRLVWISVVAKTPGWLTLMVEKLCSMFSLPPPQFLLDFRDPIFVVPIVGELRFEVNWVTVVQLVVHIVLLVMEVKHVDWKMFISTLGPHYLFQCWFVLCREFVSHSSPWHLFIISTLLVLSPLYTILFLLSPAYFWYQYGLFSLPFYYSISSIAILLVFSIVVFLIFKLKRDWILNLSLEYVFLGFLGLCIGVLFFLCGWYVSLYQVPEPLGAVSISEYNAYCGPGNWNEGNMIQTQINCMHLQGRLFSARGKVGSVRIIGTRSRASESIHSLPSFIQKALTCYMGKTDPMCGNRRGMTTCVKNGCHFQHTLAYTFEVEMTLHLLDGQVRASLLVSDSHKEFMLNLRSGTLLDFDAAFVEGMGSEHVTLQAVHMSTDGLEDTQDTEEEKEEEMKKSMVSTLLRSIKNSISLILQIFFGYVIK